MGRRLDAGVFDPGTGVGSARGFRARRLRRRASARYPGGGYGVTGELEMETGSPPADALARAVELNRRYAQSLGWQAHFDRIVPVLGFTSRSPDETSFARALALWQGRQGLTADGVLGPRTWAALQPALGGGASAAPAAPAAPSVGGGFLKDSPRLLGAPLAPGAPIPVDAGWPRDRQALARTYNRLGGLMRTVAAELGFDTAGVLAVWRVESGGREHTVGRAVIRFENHYLWDRWGKGNPALFDQHFRYGGRGGVPGKRWEGHQFRESPSGAWESVHTGKQASEYRALDLAIRLAGDHAALQCISLGGPQIMGAHYRDIGYATPRAMYDAFQASERAHVLGFFDFCRTKPAPKRGDLIRYLQQKNWREFARYYNGAGQVDTYGGLIGRAYAEASRLPIGSGGELELAWEADPELEFGYELEDGADSDAGPPAASPADEPAAGGGDAEPEPAQDAPPAEPPAWNTPDGHVLRLPAYTIETIVDRVRRPGRRFRLRPDVAAGPRRAVVRRVGQLAQNARRMGTLRSRSTGKAYPVFTSRAGGRSYRIVARPRGNWQSEIMLVQPEGEMEVTSAKDPAGQKGGRRVRGARVTIDWRATPLASLEKRPPDDNVYVIAKEMAWKGRVQWVPIYVGITKDFVQRWRPRFKVLREFQVDLKPYMVWTGKVTALPSQVLGPGATQEDVWRDVEHVLIRRLRFHDGYPLSNEQSIREVVSAAKGIAINSRQPPPFLKKFDVAPGTVYEAEAGFGASLEMEEEISDDAAARAVERNRAYARALDWGRYGARIGRLIGARTGISEADFARAVAAWQQRNGLGADGQLGPGTWKAMQKALSEPVLAQVPPPEQFRPVPLSSPGGGRVPQAEKRDPAPDDVLWVPRASGGDLVPLHREAARALVALQNAARAAGIQPPLLRPTSGYRSSSHQQVLWEQALKKYGSPEAARKWVAPPGSSAHQSGRAVDLYLGGSNKSGNVAALRKLPAYHWLVRNAARFGFYPYEAEPWHWEYNPPAPGATQREMSFAAAEEHEAC